MSEMYADLIKKLDATGDPLSMHAAVAIRQLRGHYKDLNSEAIMLARKMLEDELGISAAFFDDCVGLAIARCKKAEAANSPD